MHGTKALQSSMLCLISTESRIPERHPLRAAKKMVDVALKDLAPVFAAKHVVNRETSIQARAKMETRRPQHAPADAAGWFKRCGVFPRPA